MTNPNNRYTRATLREQRARTAGEITDLYRQIANRQKDLEHLDAVLGLLDPAYRPESVAPIKTYRRIKIFKPGDLGRLIVGVLRNAHRSLSTHDIASALGLDGDCGNRKLTARVRANLAYLESTGRVRKLGKGRSAQWCLTSSRGNGRLQIVS